MSQLAGFDYRKELKLILAERKCRNVKYSLRAFARDLHISVTALHGALNGNRHLSKKNIEHLGMVFGWTQQKLNQAKESAQVLADPTFNLIEEDQFQMIADWIHLAILNLSEVPNCRVAELPNRLGLPVNEVKDAVDRLLRLNFVALKKGILIRQYPNFGTKQDVPSQAVRSFHFKNLLRAQEALHKTPLELRDFLTIAVPTNAKQIAEMKKLIQEFRKLSLKTLETNSPEDVYFLNVQLYPISTKEIQQ